MRLSVLFLALTMTQGAFAQDEVPAEAASVDVDAAGLDQAARLLFESASRAYEAGNFTDALARYTNAYQLSDRAELLYNIAICHDRLEQKEEAADYYERFVAAVPDSPRVGIARSRGEILRTSLDANTQDTDAQNTDAQDTDAQNTEAQDTDAQNTEAQDSDTRDHNDALVEPPASSRSLAGPIASFAVGGAGLVTFVVAGLISSSRLSGAEETCGEGTCDVAELDGVDRAALIADIGLGLAIAGTAVGVVWLLVGGGGDDGDEVSAHFAPVASPSTLGAQVSGSF